MKILALFFIVFAIGFLPTDLSAARERSSSHSDARSIKGGDKGRSDRSSSRPGVSNRRGRAGGRVATNRSSPKNILSEIEEEVEEVVESVEEENFLSSAQKAVVQFPRLAKSLQEKLTSARAQYSTVGLGVKNYSMDGSKCLISFGECASQSSICKTDLSGCVDLSSFEIEEKTYFCLSKLSSKCHPNIHEKMFVSLLKSIENRGVKILASQRPFCVSKIDKCIQKQCAGEESPYDRCLSAGLSTAKSACSSVVNLCEKKYTGIWNEFEKKFAKIKVKIQDEKNIYEDACTYAGGKMQGRNCVKTLEFRFLRPEKARAYKKAQRKGQSITSDMFSVEIMSFVLDEKMPTRQICSSEGAAQAFEAFKKKQKRNKWIATGAVAAVGFGATLAGAKIGKDAGVINKEAGFFKGDGTGFFNAEKSNERLENKGTEKALALLAKRNLKTSALDDGLSASAIRKLKTGDDLKDALDIQKENEDIEEEEEKEKEEEKEEEENEEEENEKIQIMLEELEKEDFESKSQTKICVNKCNALKLSSDKKKICKSACLKQRDILVDGKTDVVNDAIKNFVNDKNTANPDLAVTANKNFIEAYEDKVEGNRALGVLQSYKDSCVGTDQEIEDCKKAMQNIHNIAVDVDESAGAGGADDGE
ncbi:MAG: hypothetical protein ACTSXV_00135 [Alphaproteobacteria bacterium]